MSVMLRDRLPLGFGHPVLEWLLFGVGSPLATVSIPRDDSLEALLRPTTGVACVRNRSRPHRKGISS